MKRKVGAALARGIPVFVVGDCAQTAKACGFHHHPLVYRAASVEDALRRAAFGVPITAEVDDA